MKSAANLGRCLKSSEIPALEVSSACGSAASAAAAVVNTIRHARARAARAASPRERSRQIDFLLSL